MVHHESEPRVAQYVPQTQDRVFNPGLGGGALLDIGIYPIAAASLCFGCSAPVDITAVGTLGATGVDEIGSLALKYPGGGVGTIGFTIRAQTPEEATFIGPKAYIRLASPAHAPTKLTLVTPHGRSKCTEETFEFPLPENKGPPLHFPASQGFQCVVPAFRNPDTG